VAIRRIRGLLKQHTGKEARAIRKDLGRLARHTNAARDWDTFARYAFQALDETGGQAMQPLLQRQLAAAHDEALQMLASDAWSTAMGQWQRYLKQESAKSFSRSSATGDLNAVREKAAAAKNQALASGDARDWHAFRIAIKDLRYHLDTGDPVEHAARKQVKAAIKLCKKLQDDLGCWHDTVVHRRLLAQLEAMPEAAGEEEIARAVDTLGSAIRARGEACLGSVMATLAGKPELLKADAGQEPSWDRR
jgi:CHAD domain-containing protein